MKRLKLIPIIAVAAFLLSACNSVPVNETGELSHRTDLPCSDKSWLKRMIISLSDQTGQQAEIIQYTYNNQIVYYIDDCKGCADSMQIVYSCTGEQLCTFGGIAGFNTCPDFFEKATDKKIIWQN